MHGKAPQPAASQSTGFPAKGPRVVIIGSGVSGILAGVKLLERGWNTLWVNELTSISLACLVSVLSPCSSAAPSNLT